MSTSPVSGNSRMSDVESPSSTRPERATATWASEFTPLPRIGVLESARRYWLLVLVSVAAFTVAGAAVARTRPAVYTAESRLNVGRLNISAPGAISGFAQAAEDLASAYSRAITADGIVEPIAQRFHTTGSLIRSRISATPVPTSPIVRVIATAPSASEAIKLANAGSDSLVSFLNRLSRDDPDADRLLKRVSAAEQNYQSDLATLQSAHATPPLDPHAQSLTATVEAAHIQVTALEAAYAATVQTEASSSLLQPLTSAHSASSNKSSILQIGVFAGIVLGAAVGLALATLRTNQLARRTLLAPAWGAVKDSGSEAR